MILFIGICPSPLMSKVGSAVTTLTAAKAVSVTPQKPAAPLATTPGNGGANGH